MTTLPAAPFPNQDTRPDTDTGRRLVLAGVVVGTIAAVTESVPLGFQSTTPGTGHYQYAADYWLTASALPHALAALLVMVGIHRLQRGRDGRLGLAGLVVNVVSLLALSTIIVASLVLGHEVQAGPTYVVGTLGTFVGTAVFAAGSWRVGLLPRWVLAIWPFVWVIGSFAAFSASPLLLIPFYAVLVAVLARR
jgi:hypothetical protein